MKRGNFSETIRRYETPFLFRLGIMSSFILGLFLYQNSLSEQVEKVYRQSLTQPQIDMARENLSRGAPLNQNVFSDLKSYLFCTSSDRR